LKQMRLAAIADEKTRTLITRRVKKVDLENVARKETDLRLVRHGQTDCGLQRVG